jgi:hypothetical protein
VSDDRPSITLTLTRHFFQAFFRLGFLDDAGEESFKRSIIGVLAGVLAFGLLLARIYLGKYRALAAQSTPDLYRTMLPADQLLMICLPMFAVAFVMALVSHSLFPDDVDFRVLMALPISRRTVFVAKLTALCLFATMFIVCANIAIGLPFSLVSSGRWADHSLGLRAVAQLIAGIFASVFAVSSTIAVQGLIVVLTPRSWLRRVTVATQTTLMCGLMLSIPLIVRVPTLSASIGARAGWLQFAPPVWFLGLQQWLLGNRVPYFTLLGLTAVLGTAAVIACGTGCYLIVYRRFDQMVMCTATARTPLSGNIRVWWPVSRHPAYEAVRRFTSATLRRSGLHQLVFFGVFASGVAIAVNSVLGSIGLSARWLISASLGVPLTLMAAAVVGLRAAFLLPANLRAAWIFRLTEGALSRWHQLNAIRHTLLAVGVMAPAALAFPVQAAVLGIRGALVCLPVVLLVGWVLVEIVLLHLRRIPFTCTVLFGKRPAAYTLVLAFMAFNVFVSLGILLQQLALSRPTSWILVLAFLLTISVGLRWIRLQTWGRLPFEFEDYLPDTPASLGLQ